MREGIAMIAIVNASQVAPTWSSTIGKVALANGLTERVHFLFNGHLFMDNLSHRLSDQK